MSVQPLAPELLCCRTDPATLGFRSTEELPDIDSAAMGQDRAIAAIEFGVGMQREGYNLYVAGPTGIGKRTLVDHLLAQHAARRGEPSDWCYVNNFEDASRPRALSLPAGKGVQLKRDMEKLIERMLVTVPNVFRGDEYRRRITEIQEEYQEKEAKQFSDLNEAARARAMVVIRTPGGYTIGPLRDGKLMTPAQFNELSRAEQDAAKAVIEELNHRLKSIIESIHGWQEESVERVKAIDNEFIHDIIDPMLAALKSRYREYPGVLAFLDAALQDMAENVWDFMPGEPQEGNVPLRKQVFANEHLRYHINVLVDHDGQRGMPVLYEDNPTLQNVLGRIEHIAQMGTLLTNFSLIKPGALHRANGGYLVLDARKILMNSFVWDGLKRAIRSREIRIESIEHILGMVSTTSLEPEPIPLDVKIVLVGDRYLYHLLQHYDPEFSLYFKVNADFSDGIDRSPEAIVPYARIIATLARREKARPLSAGGVARVIDRSSRSAEDASKLSLHLGGLVDLILQADFWAGRDASALVEAHHVDQAIAQYRFRNNRYQELLGEQIHKGVMLLATEGTQVGQINGLSVIQLGDYSFGRPVAHHRHCASGVGQAGGYRARDRARRPPALEGSDDPRQFPGTPLRTQPATGAVGEHRVRTILRPGGRRLGVDGGTGRPAVGNRRHSDPPGSGDDRFGESAWRDAGHRWRERQDRGFLRCLRGAWVEWYAGGGDPARERAAPDAETRGRSGGMCGALPCLRRRRRGRGAGTAHRGACRGTAGR
jgi:predicted ATP-dependent protease